MSAIIELNTVCGENYVDNGGKNIGKGKIMSTDNAGGSCYIWKGKARVWAGFVFRCRGELVSK